MKDMTRKQFREQTASAIKEVADFGTDNAIRCNVDLIRHKLDEIDGKIDVDYINKRLTAIEECCKAEYAKHMQSYHAFEMMRHFALAIGEKYDPMY